ncbi:MAG: hypothetical protein ACOY3U_02435 [Bacillota bacterium]
MKDEAGEIGAGLKERFGDKVAVKFVDVTSDELQNYPEIKEILDKVRLPLTVINGKPKFHGGLAFNMIADAVEGLIAES